MNYLRQWVCRHLCGSQFFDSDASKEVDRLTVICDQQAEIIGLQERRIAELERSDAPR